ncbi:hypothetical protein KBA41_02950 [Candidatus Ozemobacteraceae bacterium]|nr:hypothetical protein [Candidatus Ozemobacteraceae bacterium]
MKSLFRTVCCFVLIASLLFQAAPQVLAQSCDVYAVLNGAHAALEEARCAIACSTGYASLQVATRYLDQARSIVGNYTFAGCYRHLASDLRRGIDKAKVQILWNDRGDALEIVVRLLRTVERAQANPSAHARNNRSAAGALVAAPVAAGLGALLWGLFRGWNWGQVSTGIGTQLNNRFTLNNHVFTH